MMGVLCVSLVVALIGAWLVTSVADMLTYTSPSTVSRDVPWAAVSAVLLCIAFLVAMGGAGLAIAIDEMGGFGLGAITLAFGYSLAIGARWCWRRPL